MSNDAQEPTERISDMGNSLIYHIDIAVGTSPTLSPNKEPNASIEETERDGLTITVELKEEGKNRSRKRERSAHPSSSDTFALSLSLKMSWVQEQLQKSRTKQREYMIEVLKKENQKLLKKVDTWETALKAQM